MAGNKGGGRFDRREVIIGAAGALAAGEAKAEERWELTSAQQEARATGMRELQSIARTETREVARAFVAYRDGRSEWVPIPITQQRVSMGNGPDALQAIPAEIDHRVLDRLVRVAEQGGRVEDFHTHPSSLGDTRIPPSPQDFMSSLQIARRTANANGTMRMGTVSEAGTYGFGPASPESGQRLLTALDNAVRPSVEEMRSNRRGGRDIAVLIEASMREAGVQIPTTALDSLRNGRFPDTLLENPASVMGLAHIEGLLASRMASASADARSYLASIARAREALQSALRAIDPQTDGLINMPPANGADTAYIERWKRLGFSVEFSEHPAS